MGTRGLKFVFIPRTELYTMWQKPGGFSFEKYRPFAFRFDRSFDGVQHFKSCFNNIGSFFVFEVRRIREQGFAFNKL
ncbi:hypothetical protein EBR21_04830 [bacterium]|nr:hypothetical protein [bacterium]